MYIHTGTYQNPASSCQQIAKLNPSSLPGYSWVTSRSSSPAFVYCTPNTHCCTNVNVQGWMRVANLDMTDHRQGCPTGFNLTTSPKRGCFRITTPGCTSVTFDTYSITYSNVCGRVIGYKHHTLDAFRPYYIHRHVTLDGQYVDGVSITHGRSPRKHIWTFAAAYSDTPDRDSCPCTRTGTAFSGVIPPFINNEYFVSLVLPQSHCGMVGIVHQPAHVAPSTILRGSASNSLRTLLMTLKSECVQIKNQLMKIFKLKSLNFMFSDCKTC